MGSGGVDNRRRELIIPLQLHVARKMGSLALPVNSKDANRPPVPSFVNIKRIANIKPT
jgi:hypothetical protein